MENNKTVSIMDLINAQETTRRTRASNFTEYTSKKKLFESGILTDEQREQIALIKNTFSFSVDKSNEYLIIALYNRDAEKKYTFFILNLKSMTGVPAQTIKTAKEEVLRLLEVKSKIEEDVDVQVEIVEPIEVSEIVEPVAEEVIPEAIPEVVEEEVEKPAKRTTRTRKTTTK